MAAHQAPPSLGFSRQRHWSGLPSPSPMHESEKWNWSHWVVSNFQRPHGLQPTRLLHPWDFPGKSARVGCHCLLQIFRLAVLKDGLPWWLSGKESSANSEDVGLRPRSGNPLEKEMATHYSILAWEILWTKEPGGLQSMGSQKSRIWLSN